MRSTPSTEVLGYCQSSRFAGLYLDFLCKASADSKNRATAAPIQRFVMRVSVVRIPPSISRRMFMRLTRSQTDDIGVLEFMFLF